MTFEQIQDKVESAKDLEFGDVFDKCIDLFKKVWLKGFLMVLILVVIAMVLGFLFNLLGLGANSFDFNKGLNIDLFSDMSTNSIYSLPQTIIISSLSLALLAGYYKICKQIDLGKTENDDYFYFFKGDYIGKVFILGAIYALIATVAQLLFLIPYIYVFVPLSYFAIIFSNNPDLTETEIVKASFKLGNKKWLITFGLLIVCSLIGFLGIIGCGVGILFTISIAYLPVYFIYKEIIGFEEHTEIDLIGQPEDL